MINSELKFNADTLGLSSEKTSNDPLEECGDDEPYKLNKLIWLINK